MPAVTYERDGFLISTDKILLDIDVIHSYLSERSYWAQGRSLAVTRTAIENSLCFGVYDGAALVGFARVVTDYATFGWLADVFILESHRGRGLAKWLVQCVVSHPDLQGLKQIILATRDAHELYRKYAGFQPVPPERFMARRAP